MALDVSYEGLAKIVSDIEFAILDGGFNADALLDKYEIERGSALARQFRHFVETAKAEFETFQTHLKSLKGYRAQGNYVSSSQEEMKNRQNIRTGDVSGQYFIRKKSLIESVLKEIGGSNGRHA